MYFTPNLCEGLGEQGERWTWTSLSEKRGKTWKLSGWGSGVRNIFFHIFEAEVPKCFSIFLFINICYKFRGILCNRVKISDGNNIVEQGGELTVAFINAVVIADDLSRGGGKRISHFLKHDIFITKKIKQFHNFLFTCIFSLT